MGTCSAIVAYGAVRHISGARQKPRHTYGEQKDCGYDRSRLFASQIANEGRDFIEVGVVQKIGDMVEAGGSIMNVARHLRKVLFKIAGCVMTCRRQSPYPQSGRSSLLRSGFRICE